LGIPLVVGEQIIGVLTVQDYSDVNCYGKKQQRILESLSMQIAKTINSKCTFSTLRQVQERYQAFVEENSIGQFIAGVDGTVTDCNPAFMQLMGCDTYQEVIRARVNILGSIINVQCELLKRLQKTPTIYEYAMKLSDVSGNTVAVVANYFAVRDNTGACICIKGTVVPKETKKQKAVQH
jgi:PAS domain-containing protein